MQASSLPVEGWGCYLSLTLVRRSPGLQTGCYELFTQQLLSRNYWIQAGCYKLLTFSHNDHYSGITGSRQAVINFYTVLTIKELLDPGRLINFSHSDHSPGTTGSSQAGSKIYGSKECHSSTLVVSATCNRLLLPQFEEERWGERGLVFGGNFRVH